MTHNTRVGPPAATAHVPRAALALPGCGGGNDGSTATAPPTNANRRPATVAVANAGNKILVDSHGRTLHLFQKHSATKSRELE